MLALRQAEGVQEQPSPFLPNAPRQIAPQLPESYPLFQAESSPHGTWTNCSQTSDEQYSIVGCPWWLSGKESACQCRRCGFDLWVRKSLWRRKRRQYSLQYSCLENPMDTGACWTIVCGVTRESDTTWRLNSSDIPLYGCAIVCLSTHLVKGILVASRFWHFWVKLL